MLKNLNIKINNQMLSIISEIDEFQGSWKLLGQMALEKLRVLDNKEGYYMALRQTQTTLNILNGGA